MGDVEETELNFSVMSAFSDEAQIHFLNEKCDKCCKEHLKPKKTPKLQNMATPSGFGPSGQISL